ncbi:VOC family protein [Microvirga ossetica]|jgi:catechol 2,3-dioxygenase-like lactoylglutathione lyase family enzyme|uniref:VOC family protein n=1 Tax=Microvirga ossetica TaxID=1882682 RepID=UPI0026C45E8B
MTALLAKKDAIATVAVTDLAKAKAFYENTLGLEPVEGDEGSVQSYRAGSSTLLVYESSYAGTNKATAVTWPVGDDLDAVIRDLKAKGVTFEHYDMPGAKHDGDVHDFGKLRVAWFKDPDGNIFNLGNF